jgi:hypothetical protein
MYTVTTPASSEESIAVCPPAHRKEQSAFQAGCGLNI